MEALALYRQGRYPEALALAQQKAEPETAVLALLALGEAAEAQALLEAWQPRDGDDTAQAERLALLGFAAFRRGDTRSYQRLSLAAAQIDQTPLTLYHLGLSLSPREGLVALQQALHCFEGPAEEEACLAYALARTLRRLGRFTEALSPASLAVLRSPQPYYRLEELTLLALVGEEPLASLEKALPPLLVHQAVGVRRYALWLALLLQGMQGEADQESIGALLAQAPSQSLVYHLPLLVLLVKDRSSPASSLSPSSASTAYSQLTRLLRAAEARLSGEALPQALLRLAEGLVHYPRSRAQALLEESLPTLEADWAEEALRAMAHLCALQGQSLPEAYQRMAQSLRPEARSLFLPAELPSPVTPYLRALGQVQVLGLPPLRGRSLELLVLLLAYPEGLSGEKLSQELYGQVQLEALKTELYRLRQLGLHLASRPYRLFTPVEADFLAVEEALREGRLAQALTLYTGPLLPRSQAPGIELLRNQIEEKLKQAILRQPEPELLYLLAQRLPHDLLVWEALLQHLPPHDPRRPAVKAWVRRLSAEYR
jgi:hypothetical protein